MDGRIGQQQRHQLYRLHPDLLVLGSEVLKNRIQELNAPLAIDVAHETLQAVEDEYLRGALLEDGVASLDVGVDAVDDALRLLLELLQHLLRVVLAEYHHLLESQLGHALVRVQDALRKRRQHFQVVFQLSLLALGHALQEQECLHQHLGLVLPQDLGQVGVQLVVVLKLELRVVTQVEGYSYRIYLLLLSVSIDEVVDEGVEDARLVERWLEYLAEGEVHEDEQQVLGEDLVARL